MGREVNVDGLLILQPVREEIQAARETCALMCSPLKELHPIEFLNHRTHWTVLDLKLSQR
jgi:hypothetical protein